MIDKSRFIETFKAEAEEHLAKLSQGLVRLEKTPDERDVLEELFRSAHTLKGSASMMGFAEIQKVTHRLEDLFDEVRNGRLAVTPIIISKSLAAVDALTPMLQAAIADKACPVNAEAICQELQTTQAPVKPEAVPAAVAPEPVAKPTLAVKSVKPKPAKPAPIEVPVASQEPATAAVDAQFSETVRLPISRIDALLNLMGELVIYKVKSSYKMTSLRKLMGQVKMLEQQIIASQASEECSASIKKFKQEMNEFSDYAVSEMMRIDPIIEDLQFKIKGLRMLPCAVIFERFERLVRDLSLQQKKQAALFIKGQETELDKTVLEAIAPCLIHILRNAVDHGLETPEERLGRGKPEIGVIQLSACQQGGKVVIQVRDDGRGMDVKDIKAVALKKKLFSETELSQMSDAEAINIVFIPGFSTSALITDVSGRGVGMDVVQKEVTKLKGKVSLETQVGEGSCVTIELPLTVAIMRILLVEASGQKFGLPLLAVEEALRVKQEQIQTIENRMAVQLRNHVVPVVRLEEALNMPLQREDNPSDNHVLVIVNSLGRRVGFMLDRILGEEETFIKSLGKHLERLDNVDGAAILGSGEVIAILDVNSLVSSSRVFSPITYIPTKNELQDKKHILLVEDSFTVRELEKNILEAQGYEVETAVDGLDALEKIQAQQFDLIVSDVQMPRMDGFEFCQAVREQPKFQDLPVIFVTSLEKEEEKRRGIEVGAQAYIVKQSFDQSNLLETILRVIG